MAFRASSAASIASRAGSFCEQAATASTAASVAAMIRKFTGGASGRLDAELFHDARDLRLRVAGRQHRLLEGGARHLGCRLAPGIARGVVLGDGLLPLVAAHALGRAAALRSDLLVHGADHRG